MTAAARVLVVEDDEELRSLLCEVLETRNIHVDAVDNGADAIDFLGSHMLPAVILLDLQMPVMDGFEFRRRQLEHVTWCAIPVVILSAQRDLATQSKSMDVAGCLAKPVDVGTLLKLIARLLKEGAHADNE